MTWEVIMSYNLLQVKKENHSVIVLKKTKKCGIKKISGT